jgi:hypothetical protein
VLTHFQIEMLIYMTGQLSERTAGRLVERAWAVIQDHYKFHEELFALSSRTSLALAILVVRGWKIREVSLRATTGSAPATPEYIVRLRGLIPSSAAETKHAHMHTPVDEANKMAANADMKTPITTTATATATATATRAGPQGLDMPWDQMLGFVDVGALDWDMFAGSSENAGMGVHPAGYGMDFGSQQSNSWM